LARAAAGGAVTLLAESVAQASARSLSAVVASSVGIGMGVGLVLAGAAQLAFPESSASRSAEPSARAVATHSLALAARPALVVEAPRASTEAPETSPNPSAASDTSAAPTALKRSTATLPPSASSGAAAGSPLRAELDLMAHVQEALRDNQGARALTLIASYDALYPSGVLTSERLAAEVFAACQMGDRTRARRAAARFLTEDSRSSLATRVRNACADREP
jgi:hypothetical protein